MIVNPDIAALQTLNVAKMLAIILVPAQRALVGAFTLMPAILQF